MIIASVFGVDGCWAHVSVDSESQGTCTSHSMLSSIVHRYYSAPICCFIRRRMSQKVCRTLSEAGYWTSHEQGHLTDLGSVTITAKADRCFGQHRGATAVDHGYCTRHPRGSCDC